MIHTIACLVIFLWATWCVLSPTVHDGVIGKAFYAMASLAAFVAIADKASQAGDQLLILSMAGLALRSLYIDRILPLLGRDRRHRPEQGQSFAPPAYKRWHP